MVVDEARARALAPGDRIDVSVDAIGDATGPVLEIERAIDQAAHAVRVKIALAPDPRLRPGAFGQARIPGERRSLITVPASALVRDGQLAMVFVADGGVARLRLVRDAPRTGTVVPLVAGLAAGELVVAAPPSGLRDGDPIIVERRR